MGGPQVRRLLLLATAAVSLAGAADPFVATWVRNVEQSEPKQPLSGTMTFSPAGVGYRVTMEMIVAGGRAFHVEFIANPDGKDVPVKGHPAFDTISMKRVDAHVLETVAKRQGKVVQTARRVVSPDGKTLTVTGTDTDSAGVAVRYKTVFDRK